MVLPLYGHGVARVLPWCSQDMARVSPGYNLDVASEYGQEVTRL